jgi:hypothetical protein
MPSSDLWYPGRIPLCTPQVIRGLEQYLEALRSSVEKQDTTYVHVARRVHEDIHAVLYEEGLDCIGSDTDINDLLTLLLRTQQAVEACAERDLWNDLEDIIDAIDTVRWSLLMKQEGGATDDGEQPGVVATPDPDERLGDRASDEAYTRETDWTGNTVAREFEAQAALPCCDDEDEEENLDGFDDEFEEPSLELR